MAEDYVRLAKKQFKLELQEAKATIDWVGSYWLVQIAVDPLATVTDVPGLVSRIEQHLNRYRRMGHRVAVHQGFKVPIALGLTICVCDQFTPEDVRADLIDRFSNRDLPDNQQGFFHPDRITFGQSIHSSRIVTVARSVTGVQDVKIDFLHRCDANPCNTNEAQSKPCDGSGNDAISEWKNFEVDIGDLEIAQLENNGNRANGYLCLNMGGGR
ncbi:hypothetical protein RMSM_02480 [Rhodopirellula maiorica SM1]|uniref:Baseplate protein J-like domain-containing protein n=1 Tax=Rhodopirellula maiorica SM1 TaxID=1265738 RepID=M5RYW4_9BACT|nr:hypothetical protein RMSM_02480 [Rhodopirellula maiorica SM1]